MKLWDAFKQQFGVWEFTWAGLDWVCIGPPNNETYHATIRVGHNKTFEVWTHDNHKTYNVMVFGPGSRSETMVQLCGYVDALTASAVCHEWFANNKP